MTQLYDDEYKKMYNQIKKILKNNTSEIPMLTDDSNSEYSTAIYPQIEKTQSDPRKSI